MGQKAGKTRQGEEDRWSLVPEAAMWHCLCEQSFLAGQAEAASLLLVCAGLALTPAKILFL